MPQRGDDTPSGLRICGTVPAHRDGGQQLDEADSVIRYRSATQRASFALGGWLKLANAVRSAPENTNNISQPNYRDNATIATIAVGLSETCPALEKNRTRPSYSAQCCCTMSAPRPKG